MIDSNNNIFTTYPYKKPTSINSCIINYKSECSAQYKKAIIKNLINRAKLTSSKTIFFSELKNIKQTLLNNEFPNYFVDEQIRKTLHNIYHNENTRTLNSPNQNIYYCNQMHQNYKLDENEF